MSENIKEAISDIKFASFCFLLFSIVSIGIFNTIRNPGDGIDNKLINFFLIAIFSSLALGTLIIGLSLLYNAFVHLVIPEEFDPPD